MKTHEINIEMEYPEIRDDIERMMAHPAILKNFCLMAEERFTDNRCVCHNRTIHYKAIEVDNQAAYQLKACCDDYGKLGAKFLSGLRDDVWKLCMVMTITHKKIGCERFAQIMEKLEKYEFKGINDFFGTFFQACIQQAVVDDAGVSDSFKKEFEEMMKGSHSSVH